MAAKRYTSLHAQRQLCVVAVSSTYSIRYYAISFGGYVITRMFRFQKSW